ncbi:MAG TPA: hypothetical protein VGL20_19170 [Candidatus Dormibacteraeota bacterium]
MASVVIEAFDRRIRAYVTRDEGGPGFAAPAAAMAARLGLHPLR